MIELLVVLIHYFPVEGNYGCVFNDGRIRVRRDPVFPAPIPDLVKGGYDQGAYEFFFGSDNNSLFDETGFFELVLNGRRGNIFSPAGFKQFFFPVGDAQKLPVFKLPDISRMKPAVNNGFGCKVRSFEITFHHTGPFNANFPVGFQPDLHAIDHGADGSELTQTFSPAVDGNDRRILCWAITFIYGNSRAREYAQ